MTLSNRLVDSVLSSILNNKYNNNLLNHFLQMSKSRKVDDLTCNKCRTKFTSKYKLRRHNQSKYVCVNRTLRTDLMLFECEYCQKNFARYDNLKAHYATKSCSDHRPEDINDIEMIPVKLVAFKRLVAFGQENVGEITLDDIDHIFNPNGNIIENYIKTIHLNPDNPRLRNIYYANASKKYGKLFNGNTWQTVKIKLLVNSVIKNTLEKIHMIFEKFKLIGLSKNKKIKDRVKESSPEKCKYLFDHVKEILSETNDLPFIEKIFKVRYT